jgi:hypothetical protein
VDPEVKKDDEKEKEEKPKTVNVFKLVSIGT